MTTGFSFNLLDEPWLLVVDRAGANRILGIREALLTAHELVELSGDSPLEQVALHRLLLAVLHRIYGPEDYEAWGSLWEEGRFPAGPLNTYLDQWRQRFDLFDGHQPFYQAADTRVRSKSVISLIQELASGNNPTFFDHNTELRGAVLTPDRAARALVTAQVFSLAGLCDPSQKLSFTDGNCARGVVFLIAGDNLFQTLLLNMVQYPDEEPLRSVQEDRPAWEMDDAFMPDREMPFGYLDYLTWQNRRILLQPEASDQGIVVREMTMGPGLRIDPTILDPMKHYRKDTKKGFLVRRFSESRALWRDSAALLALPDSEEDFAPLTIRWLRELVHTEHVLDTRHLYRYLALGMANDQARVFFYRSERMPFPLAYLDEPQLVRRLRDATDAAEQARGQLWGAARALARFVLSPHAGTAQGHEPAREDLDSLVAYWDPERHFWATLEQPFQRLVVDLPGAPDAALAAWYETVQQVAWGALEKAVRQAGEDVRALKAGVRARAQLGAGLRKIPVFDSRKEEPV
jgi:CRISPR system Cascade subunit CasA